MFNYFVEQTGHFVFSMGSVICDCSVLECCHCLLFREHFDPTVYEWSSFREYKITGVEPTS